MFLWMLRVRKKDCAEMDGEKKQRKRNEFKGIETEETNTCKSGFGDEENERKRPQARGEKIVGCLEGWKAWSVESLSCPHTVQFSREAGWKGRTNVILLL